ncbi:MAG: HEAT repeat domain-containing protein [Candidatus Omnitrophica bacterium]|nr:HEAT repeat domain-containing protein [Candidatus Omnitrophota bacterium]
MLIEEVVSLFECIKEAYEKDIDASRRAWDREFTKSLEAKASQAATGPIQPGPESLEDDEEAEEEDLEEETEEVEEELAGEEDEDGPEASEDEEDDTEEAPVERTYLFADNKEAAEEEEEDEGEEDEEESEAVPESVPREERSEEEEDYGLFETAERKLTSQIASEREKFEMFHTLFRSSPKKSVRFIYELIKAADLFLRRQLFPILREMDYPTLVDVYRRFIADEESSLRLHGMMGLVKLGSDEAKHTMTSAIRDVEPNVRRFIVNCLDHKGNHAEATAIARLSLDDDETVRRVAIRKLGLMGNHFALINLVPKLENENEGVRRGAIEALKKMTGTDMGYDPAASPSERRKCARQWKTLASKSAEGPHVLRELVGKK